jgi:hypothetical protein
MIDVTREQIEDFCEVVMEIESDERPSGVAFSPCVESSQKVYFDIGPRGLVSRRQME